MSVFWSCLLILAAALADAQTIPKPTETERPDLSVADFGLVYPLSSDWVQTKHPLRRIIESKYPSRNFDVLLAASYWPTADVSADSPSFWLFAYREPGTDCKTSLEHMLARSQVNDDEPERGIVEFSAAGRHYFRVDAAQGVGGRYSSHICTAANGHLLVWTASARNKEGLEPIVATLNSITPISPPSQDSKAQGASMLRLDQIKVPEGLEAGLLVKRVEPVYPPEARSQHLEGTVWLQVEINGVGDVIRLDVLDGPTMLATSAVTAVRQWKYKPSLFKGRPVSVVTEVRVNYHLQH